MKFLTLILLLFFISTAYSSELLNKIMLKTAYQDHSAPKYIGDTGKQGICFDIIKELNKKLKNVKISETSYPKSLRRIKYELQTGEIDIFVGLAKNKERIKIYKYINEPLYKLESTFAKLKNNPFEYTNDSSLIGKTISTVSGSKTEKELKKIKGIIIDSSPNIDSAIKKVSFKRTELLYYHKLGILYNLKMLNIKNVILTKKPFNTYYHYIAFNQKVNNKIIKEIETALIQIKKAGIIDKIILKYTSISD